MVVEVLVGWGVEKRREMVGEGVKKDVRGKERCGEKTQNRREGRGVQDKMRDGVRDKVGYQGALLLVEAELGDRC